MRKAADIQFDALRNAIYHSARRSYYDALNRSMSFLVVASGTAAVADAGKWLGVDSSYQLFALAAALAGLSQLVFDFGGKARTHEFLQRRFYELISEMGADEPSPEQLIGWDSRLNGLYAEEPPPMRALDAVAYNAAIESLGRDKGKRVHINIFQSWLRHLVHFNGSAFPYVDSVPDKSTVSR